jgi:hypothetical protein
MAWNPETNVRTVLVSEPFDQGHPDADGHLVSYLDSQASGAGYWSGYHAEVKIIDRDTLVQRTVLPLDSYFGTGIWSHYLVSNNVGMWGDSLILCDLEAGGLVDTDGHVIPESTPDAGVDGGK